MSDASRKAAALVAAATPGPWERPAACTYVTTPKGDICQCQDVNHIGDSENNAELIAAAPELLATLAAELERLEADNASLRELLLEAVPLLQYHDNGHHHCRWCARASARDSHESTCWWSQHCDAIDRVRNRAREAELEAENARLRLEYCECVVCKAALLETEEPPRCLDCDVTTEHYEEWERAREALKGES